MTTIGNRFLFLIFALTLVVVVWGCAQTDDVVARKSVTEVFLTAERIPTAPVGMIYEFWASRKPVTGKNIPANELVSIGRFSYLANDTISAFLDDTGAVRMDSNLFRLQGDILDFSSLIVTVEVATDPPGGTPGPILLVSPVSTRSSELMLQFPLNDILTEDASIAYNMEGVTDGDRSLNDASGVWFSFYQQNSIRLSDTNNLDSVVFETTTIDPVIDPISGDTTNLAEIHDSNNIDSILYSFDTVPFFFGRDTIVFVNEFGPGSPTDTLFHVSMTRDTFTSPDNSFPFTTVKLSQEFFDTLARQIDINVFRPSGFEMPDFTDWGWKYEGWVTSTEIPVSWVGSMTLPAWDVTPGQSNLIPGHDGGLLTTGTFNQIDQPDDSDPFTFRIFERVIDTGGVPDTVYKRPLTPGEDFLDATALANAGIMSGGPVDLLPLPSGNTYGSVFISFEPDNRLTDTTNFPLIPFVRAFPSAWQPPPPAPPGPNFLSMINWTSTSQGTAGFPLIRVSFNRL